MGRRYLEASFNDDTLIDFLRAALGDELAADPKSGYTVLAPLAKYVAQRLVEADPGLAEELGGE